VVSIHCVPVAVDPKSPSAGPVLVATTSSGRFSILSSDNRVVPIVSSPLLGCMDYMVLFGGSCLDLGCQAAGCVVLHDSAAVVQLRQVADIVLEWILIDKMPSKLGKPRYLAATVVPNNPGLAVIASCYSTGQTCLFMLQPRFPSEPESRRADGARDAGNPSESQLLGSLMSTQK
jgi:hypothetical protein